MWFFFNLTFDLTGKYMQVQSGGGSDVALSGTWEHHCSIRFYHKRGCVGNSDGVRRSE